MARRIRAVNPELIERWGRAVAEMARGADGSRTFFDLLQNGFARKTPSTAEAYRQFLDICRRIFGRDGIEGFNRVMGEFYRNAGVVPRAQYDDLEGKYRTPRSRVRGLERELEALKFSGSRPVEAAGDMMEKWTETARSFTELNRKFVEELSKFFR
jgi:hypothetical protein